MTDHRDLTADNGSAPAFAKPEPTLGEVGQGGGYSGQEYDSAGQEGWRDQDQALGVAPDGEVRGSGSPSAEIDPGTPGADSEPDQEDEADSNGQQDVEDRPNVGIVTPDDYPQQQ